MGTHTGSVMTLANSIIGVSVLAMPFCFKQCGIVLSIVMLILSNVVTRLACYYLIKSAVMEKRKNFEMLAFRVLGRSGKLIVELCIIGFMLGTCVAFFVVVGDLGPTILAEIIGVEHPSALRPSVLIGVGVFVVLPLGLLRNVESLSTLCAASIAFYFCLVLKVMGEATSHLLAWDWVDKVWLWRPAGVLQCIPIFSMALSCQTQLFEVFDSLPSTPMERMNSIIRSAINMTTTFYIAVGFFGYVAFCNQPFTGNLLINLSPSLVSYVIKCGFVLSVAVSFPLVIFPCRASIYSLIFTTGNVGGGMESSSHIPETKFQCITLLIVTLSLVTGLLVPSIEAVLGFVGSTIGFFVCIILPSIIFVCLSKKNTSERLLAKVLVCTGLLTMVLSTYANLTAVESNAVNFPPPDVPVVIPVILDKSDEVHAPVVLPEKLVPPDPPKKLEVREEDMKNLKDVGELKKLVLPKLKEAKETKLENNVVDNKDINSRQEPPVPEVKSRQEPPNPVPDEPKVPPKKKKTMLVPPLIKTDDDNKIKTKIDIEEIKKSMEKLDLPKSVEVEKVEEKLAPIPIQQQQDRPILNVNETHTNISKLVNENNKVVKTLTESLAESIVKRVPLPLAIKGKLNADKDKLRDIKEREKRDTEIEEKSNEIKNITVQVKEIKPLKELEVSKTVEHKENPGNIKESSFVKVVEQEAKLLSDKEQCPKNNTEGSHPNVQNQNSNNQMKPTVKNELINNHSENLTNTKEKESNDKNIGENLSTLPSVINNELIKTPSYLSDPKLILDSKTILHGPEPNLNLESFPLKRDLKSVQENIDPNKMEHR